MNSQNNTLAIPVSYSRDNEQLIMNIHRGVNDLVNIVNLKDMAIYDKTEQFTCQLWYLKTPSRPETIQRIVVDFGALPNTALKNVAHNLAVIADWNFQKIYGVAKDPVAIVSIPIAHPDITVRVTATNVEITTTSDLSAYTQCFVILEYTTA